MVSGLRRHGEQDFPLPVREAVTPLPFHIGGSVTLTADEVRDLVRVSELRRFENMSGVARGIHTGANNAVVLTDSTARFLEWGVEVGDEVENRTASPVTSGLVMALTATTLMVDGVTWDTSDVYVVNKRGEYLHARAVEIRKLAFTADQDIYIRYDAVPDATDGFDVELSADTAYFEENVRVASRIVVRAVNSTHTPKVKFTAWGI